MGLVCLEILVGLDEFESKIVFLVRQHITLEAEEEEVTEQDEIEVMDEDEMDEVEIRHQERMELIDLDEEDEERDDLPMVETEAPE